VVTRLAKVGQKVAESDARRRPDLPKVRPPLRTGWQE
jgi:hypothetical protein